MSSLKTTITEEDQKRISKIIQEAEKRTSGEIVPCVVPASDEYSSVVWRTTFIAGFLALIIFDLILKFTSGWPIYSWKFIPFLVLFVSGTVLFLLAVFDPLKRVFVSSREINERVTQKAREVFLMQEVFQTRERTGILIFVSLMERTVIVLGDSGINSKVNPQEWNDIVSLIISGIKQGRLIDGLVRGIEECGQLLERHGVLRRADDTNEIPNNLTF